MGAQPETSSALTGHSARQFSLKDGKARLVITLIMSIS